MRSWYQCRMNPPSTHRWRQGEELGLPTARSVQPNGSKAVPRARRHRSPAHLRDARPPVPGARVHDIVADFFERAGNGPVVAGQIAGAGLHEGAVFTVEDIHGPVLRQPAAVGAVNPRRPVGEERGRWPM